MKHEDMKNRTQDSTTATYHASKRPARDEKVDTSLGVSKVPAKMLGKGLDGRF